MKLMSACLVALVAGRSFAMLYGDTPDAKHAWAVHDGHRPNPAKVMPAAKMGDAPSDAVILFDGTADSFARNWCDEKGNPSKWKCSPEGYFYCEKGWKNGGSVFTRAKFGDCQLHIEYRHDPDNIITNQGAQMRGNSGIFLMGNYEIQVLESYYTSSEFAGKPEFVSNYADGQAGAVYAENPPMVNPARKPGEWQVYDIVFHQPVWEGLRLVHPGSVTVFFNGVLVQDHWEMEGLTTHCVRRPLAPHATEGPLFLQDHGCVVQFRNVWYRPIPSRWANQTHSVLSGDEKAVMALRRETAAKLYAKIKNPKERKPETLAALCEVIAYANESPYADDFKALLSWWNAQKDKDEGWEKWINGQLEVLRRNGVIKAESFVFSAKLDLSAPRAETLYEYPGLLRLVLRQAGSDKVLRDYDEKRGNYLNFPLADGSVPVLEAELNVSTNRYRVGVPLAYLKQPEGCHDLRVVLSKTRLHLAVDGVEVDEDYLISLPALTGGVGLVLSPRLKNVTFATPAPTDVDCSEPDVREIKENIQYWTGGGFNTWVGDVVCCRWRNRLHLFYLLDRRHHASKQEQGGHIFAHVSSPDLVHWFKHPTVVPIENTWMTAGTGTPFEWNGKLCLSYGIHSTRMVPREQTTEPAMLAAFGKTGEMAPVRFAGTELVPLGTSWAESEDGINFSHSGIVCHTTQNPGVSVMKDGSLRLVTGYWGDTGAKGIFTSKDLLHWRQTGEKPVLEGDCPCDFTWNDHHYLLQGFNGYARAKGVAPLALDRASDIYDGLSVPMVAPWGENRRLLIGWQHYPQGLWGGWLVFRELVQHEDGSLGTKWVKEISSPSPAQTWRVKGGARFELKLTRSDGRYPQAFTVDPKTSSAFLSVTLENGEVHRCWTLPRLGIAPVTGIRGLNADYCVRAVLHYDRKADATLLDAEIAGNRTFITSLPGRYAIPAASR